MLWRRRPRRGSAVPRHRKKPAPKPTFRKVTLTVPMSLSDAVSEALWELEVQGITIDDDETRARPYDPTIPKTGLATINGTFESSAGLELRVLQGLNRLLHESHALNVPTELS